MKNNLQNLITKILISGIFILLPVAINTINAQCDTKISDPNNDGKDYVCANSTTTYQAIRDAASANDTLTWALSDGGTILSVNDNGTTSTVTIQWDDTPDSGPYCLTLTEHNGCVGSDKMYIYIEKSNLNLACNDLVLVALDNNCRDTIGADKILEAPLYPDDSYTTTVFNTDNTPRAEPIVNMNDLGDTLMVVVKHDCSGIACMGRIAFQDNLATMLSCRQDTLVVKCDESMDPENPNIGFPLFPGSQVSKIDEQTYEAIIPGDCGGEFTLVYSDDIQQLECGTDYEIIIDRTWAAIDASQNSWTCSEVIAKTWANFDSVCAPSDFDGMNGRPKFQCNDPHPFNNDIYWPYKDSIPGPEITGYPTNASCSNIQFLYEDIEIPLCGYNRKILRHWIILDWCTGKQKSCDQMIVFDDSNPPIFHFPPDTLEFEADLEQCSGTAFPLPEPIVDFECSNWTWEVLGYTFKSDGTCDPEVFLRQEFVYGDSESGFGISNLPVDTAVCVSYKVTDECGKYSYGNMLVIIRDNQKPTAACETHTVVTLGDGTKLYATSLDDESWDNCGIEKYEIKRTTNRCGDFNDLQFGEYVNLCCEDVGNDVMVILRVTDSHGNFNDCMGTVTVNDKEPPVLTYCPDDFTINCTDSYVNNFIGGKPIATDICNDITMTYHDSPHLNDCGIGYVNRVWTIKDKVGLETAQKCHQKIYVIDPHPLTENDIEWPDDITIPGCWPNVNIDESVTGLPIITNSTCKNLGIAHNDQVVQNPINEDACVMIKRVFTIGDWCQPNMDYITHTQFIYVNDGGAPQFTNCTADTTIFTGAACSADVTLSAFAIDDCTDSDHLRYSYKVDKGNDGSFELTGLDNVVHTTFDRGYNKVVFTVKDACGNETSCTRFVRVRDSKAPTPICLSKISTSLGVMGMVSINAKFFDHGSTDNCTPSNMGQCGCYTELRFSYSPDVNDTLVTYTCDSLDNGVGKSFNLKVYVTDLDNNQDFCNVRINLTDSKDVCPDAPDPTFTVEGMIMDENEKGMPGFKVKGISLDQNEVEVGETNFDGTYYINGLGAYNKYEIVANKDDTPLDGLTTLDLVLIQKHILGIKKFDSPYKYIAADANNSKSISASDLLELRKLILGNYDELPSSESWKFIKAKTEFDNPANPWYYENKYITDSLMYQLDSVDFIAVKIGDINHTASAFAGASNLDMRNAGTEYFKAENVIFGPDQNITLDIKANSDYNISGFQFTLQFDPSILKFERLENKNIKLSNTNYSILKKEVGIITVSWNNAIGQQLEENESLFTFHFKSLNNGILNNTVEISSLLTRAEIYNDELETNKLKLRFEGEQYPDITVYQNTPNPFSNDTKITFELAKDDDINIKILDLTGKTIYNNNRHYSKGQNSIIITSDILKKSGLYFYEITNSNISIKKRMVLIK